MKLLLLLLMAIGAARGQYVLWLDLSGDWRLSADDRVEYASRDFDDSTWKTVQLPSGKPWSPGRIRDIQWLPALPLGLDADAVYSERILTCSASQQLTFISDGVIEAEDAKGELFGFDRTREISRKPAREIAEAAKSWGQNDHITVVTLRRAA